MTRSIRCTVVTNSTEMMASRAAAARTMLFLRLVAPRPTAVRLACPTAVRLACPTAARLACPDCCPPCMPNCCPPNNFAPNYGMPWYGAPWQGCQCNCCPSPCSPLCCQPDACCSPSCGSCAMGSPCCGLGQLPVLDAPAAGPQMPLLPSVGSMPTATGPASYGPWMAAAPAMGSGSWPLGANGVSAVQVPSPGYSPTNASAYGAATPA